MIEIKFDSSDPIALAAIGDALIKIANHHSDGDIPLYNTVTTTATVGEVSVSSQEPVSPNGDDDNAANQNDHSGQESVDPASQAKDEQENIEAIKKVVDERLDADGLPWDARIHHKDKKLNGDNTWQIRRHAKKEFPEKADWLAYVEQIKDELRAAVKKPSESLFENGDNDVDPSTLGFGKEEGKDTPPPPPPLNKGGDMPPPPPPQQDGSEETLGAAELFQRVMDTMKANRGTVTPADLTKICNEYNVDKIISLQNADASVIDAVLVRLKQIVTQKAQSNG